MSEEGRTPSRRGLGHIPALDGLRGLAVVAVLLFHADRLRGGFLGVSAFFVLSGFLITSLLLVEIDRTGHVALRAFWARRLKRLQPALLLLVVGVAVYAVVLATSAELGRIRDDAIATLTYVTNWQAIAADNGYFDAFSVPSPLEHAWSLAIEEQFYVVWPLAVGGVAWLARRRRPEATGRFGAGVVLVGSTVLALAGTALMWMLYTPGSEPTRVYLGSDTRAPEVLVGAALAGFLALRGRGLPGWRPRRIALEVAGIGAAAVLAVVWVTTDGRSDWLYRGGLLATALGVVVVIAAAAHPEVGPLARLLSWRPFRLVGLISYGLYLWHWPVYLVLTEARVGIGGLGLLVAQLAVSTALATASYLFLERPIRIGTLRLLPMAAAVPTGLAVCLVAVLLTTTGGTEPSPVSIQASVQRPAGDGADQLATPRRTRLLVMGDSVANSLGTAALAVADRLPVDVAKAAVNGCPLTAEIDGLKVEKRTTSEIVDMNPPCRPTWEEGVATFEPDIVTIVYGNAAGFEVFRLDGRWLGPCDSAYRTWYRSRMRTVVEDLVARGTVVQFATLAYQLGDFLPEDTRGRLDCMNDLNAEVAAAVPGVQLLDLASWVCPAGRCRTELAGEPLRSDGVHFGRPPLAFGGPAGEAAAEWLVAEAVRLATPRLAP